MDVKRYPNTTCAVCRRQMYRRPNQLLSGKGKFCSRACRNTAHPLPDGRNLPVLYGADNPAWKGGVTFKRNKGNYIGPKYVRCPPQFAVMARRDGYVMEHRLIVAQALGRPLARVEVVHHRDHNPRNNTLSNLELFPDNGAHKRAEGAERRARSGSKE